MKIEIINKEKFNKYKDAIDRIHMENAYPNGYLIDDDYLINADKIILVFIESRVVGYASLSKEDITPDDECSFTITLSPNNIKIRQNKGIGTTLINYIKKYAKDNNIDYIYLYSFSLNEKGKNFYLKNIKVLKILNHIFILIMSNKKKHLASFLLHRYSHKTV